MFDIFLKMFYALKPNGILVTYACRTVIKNAMLQAGFKVEADINGEKHMLENWQPYYIEGLPEGDNTIKLSLIDSTGQLANVPLNPVSRTFKIEKTPVAN